MNPATAVAHYTLKLDPIYIGSIFTAKKTDMVSQELTILADLETIEALVRGLLSGGGVTSALEFPRYQASAKEMYRATEKWIGGSCLDTRMAEIIARWTARGLSGVVLLQIAYEIFNWSPPAP